MKKLLLIILLVPLGYIWQIFGQTGALNKLENLKNIQLNDTLRIDIKKEGCFHSIWQKLIIVKENQKLQLIKIDDISGLILKYDKKAVLYNEEDSWLRKNLNKVIDSKNTTALSNKDYILVIDKIIELISTYENCLTDITGKYSNITISMNDIQEKFDFNCEIQTDL